LVVTEPVVIDVADAVAPDHSDFAAAYPAVEHLTGAPANYYLEASRGCWWGERRHCVFCGIHTSAIQFRQKSAERVLAEVTDLLARHRTFRFVLADTILAKEHFAELLPQLEQLRSEHDFEYLLDVKSSLSKQEVYLLARSGCVALQLGIESLSDRLLRLMTKGNTALQQVQAIKWCAEAGMAPYYALLTHIVDERPEDYDEVLGFARYLVHLPPPRAVVPIELDRYAPYFREWQVRGFDHPRPQPWYRLMFGPDATDLEAFAYHFDGTHPSTDGPELVERRAALYRFVTEQWVPDHASTRLTYRAGRGWLRLTRKHGGSVERRDIEGPAAALYRACDELRTGRDLRAQFADDLGPDQVDRLLGEWREQGLLVKARGRDVHLALATDERPLRARSDLGPAAGGSAVSHQPLAVVAG
ncbi:MAG: RiPP maturation radical SAM C-methyltransferase, partial [Acidimicrobiales bacterium]